MHGLFPPRAYNFEPLKYGGKYFSSRDTQYLNGKNRKRKCKKKNIHKPSAPLLDCLGDLSRFCHSCPPNQRETAKKLKHFVHWQNFCFVKCLKLSQSDQCEKHSCRECGIMIYSMRNGLICLLHIKAWHSLHVSLAALKTQLYNHKQTHTGAQLLCRHDCILEFYVLYNPVQLQLLPLARTRVLPNSPLWKVTPIKSNLITASFDCNSV